MPGAEPCPKSYMIERGMERMRVDLHAWGVEGGVVLGRYSHSTPHDPLPVHHHGELIEICYLDRGHQTYEIEGRRYDLNGGDVLVVPPGKAHSTAGEPEDRGVLYWLILEPPKGRGRFLGLPAADARHLLNRLTSLPMLQFRGRVVLRESLDAVFKATASDQNVLARSEVQNRLVRFLLDLTACALEVQPSGISPAIQEALSLMSETLEQDLPLAHYAARSGLSLSRFKVRFKQEVGTSPRDYLLRQRIERAREMLAAPEARVIDVAMALGFSSSQYFATVYKRYTGQSPSAERNESSQAS